MMGKNGTLASQFTRKKHCICANVHSIILRKIVLEHFTAVKIFTDIN
jgi:hypothetical protein